jgi:hypothetical protein
VAGTAAEMHTHITLYVILVNGVHMRMMTRWICKWERAKECGSAVFVAKFMRSCCDVRNGACVLARCTQLKQL